VQHSRYVLTWLHLLFVACCDAYFLQSMLACLIYFAFFFLMLRRPPRSTLFPYTRSSDLGAAGSFALIVHQPLRPGQAVAVANGLTGARAERHRLRRVGDVFFVRRRRTRPTLAGT